MIHEGSNAKVYFALKASTRELLVAKQYQAPLTDTEPHLSEMIQRCRLESEILRTLSHHNVVQWIAFDETRSDATVYVFVNIHRPSIFTSTSSLLEYFPGSNIEGCLERFGAFNEEVTKSFTSQILSGLEYLHSHSIIHAVMSPPYGPIVQIGSGRLDRTLTRATSWSIVVRSRSRASAQHSERMIKLMGFSGLLWSDPCFGWLLK